MPDFRAQPEPPGASLIGVVLGDKYEVEKELDSGGMGRIFLAKQAPLGRRCVVKVLDAHRVGDLPEFRKRFLREAETCARLSHPNTVTLFDFGEFVRDGSTQQYLAMEYIEGRTLGQVLVEEAPLSVRRAFRIAAEVARSIDEAHGLGIVHRDLKPTNIMLRAEPGGERVTVLDFGIAKVVGQEAEKLTREGVMLGSPRYMAPEQIRGDGVDARTDLYSLGVMLYAMVSGRAPFTTGSDVTILRGHLHERPPSIRGDLGVDIPEEAEAIVLRLLEKDPGRRYSSAVALIAALESRTWLADAPTSGGSMQPEVTRDISGATTLVRDRITPPPAPRRGLVLLGAGVVAALTALVLTLAGFALLR